MTTALKLRRGTTTQHSTFTGAAGEVTVDTTKNTVVVHNGSTVGGIPLATEAGLASQVSTLNTSIGTKATDSATVHKTGDETIAGVKTFSSAPVASAGVKLSASGWSVYESAGKLYFATGGVAKASLDATGNLIVAGNVTAYGTV